jgi:hypothetical protein
VNWREGDFLCHLDGLDIMHLLYKQFMVFIIFGHNSPSYSLAPAPPSTTAIIHNNPELIARGLHFCALAPDQTFLKGFIMPEIIQRMPC